VWSRDPRNVSSVQVYLFGVAARVSAHEEVEKEEIQQTTAKGEQLLGRDSLTNPLRLRMLKSP
jgi:hypothetical protein